MMSSLGLRLLLFAVLLFAVLADETTGSTESATGDVPATVPETAPEAASDSSSDTANKNGPESAPGNGVEGGSKASPLSSLYINTVKPGLGSPVTDKVFKEGALFGLFNSCRTAEEDSTQINDGVICFADDPFNDRLTFEMTYGVPGSDIERAFHDHPPILQLLGNSSESAESDITEKEVLVATSRAKITVSYLCRKGSDSMISLQLKLQFGTGDENTIPIVWTKQCASGVNSQLEFGYTVDGQASGDPKRHPFGSDADAPYVVPPSDVSTEVYAKLQQTGAQQEFLAPLVTSTDPEVVTVTVRGNHPNGGVLQGLEMTRFQISYECLKKGSSDIHVSVGIPPFQNLTSSWEKGKFTKLLVGSCVFLIPHLFTSCSNGEFPDVASSLAQQIAAARLRRNSLSEAAKVPLTSWTWACLLRSIWWELKT